jgi:hypothetical protein
MARRHPQALVPDQPRRIRPQPLNPDDLAVDLDRLEGGSRVGDPVVEDRVDVIVAAPHVLGELGDSVTIGGPDRANY